MAALVAPVAPALHCFGCVILWNPHNRTPFGPTQSFLIKGLALFQCLFIINKIRLGLHAVPTVQWMSLFQGCPQGVLSLKLRKHYSFQVKFIEQRKKKEKRKKERKKEEKKERRKKERMKERKK